MKIVKQSEVVKQTVEMEGVKGVQRQLMIGSKDGAPNFSFRIFTIHGNGHTPYHTHEFEHVNYALKGKGYIVDADGNEIFKYEKGTRGTNYIHCWGKDKAVEYLKKLNSEKG